MTSTYTPQINRCAPLHEVRNWAYVRSIIRAVRRGVYVPPILVDYEIEQQLTGVHRQAANELMDLLHDQAEYAESPQHDTGERIEVVDWHDLDLSVRKTKLVREAINQDRYDDLDGLLTPRKRTSALAF